MEGITTKIEKAIIAALELTDLFKYVDSLGRDEPPLVKAYPWASVFFNNDNDDTDVTDPRPQPFFYYTILVTQLNRKDEKAAARSAYDLTDEIRTLFNGKQLGFEEIRPIRVISRNIVRYKAGEITYAVRLRIPVIMAAIR